MGLEFAIILFGFVGAVITHGALVHSEIKIMNRILEHMVNIQIDAVGQLKTINATLESVGREFNLKHWESDIKDKSVAGSDR